MRSRPARVSFFGLGCSALMLSALMLAPTAGAQSVRAPYLQQGFEDSMIVAWRTASASDSVVCFGDAVDRLVVRATGASGVTDHVVQITGLEPNTRYQYEVSTTGSCPPPSAGAPEHYFRTAPVTGSSTPFSMWVVGDSGTGGSRQRQVFDAMRAERASSPDLFLHMGDMAYDNGLTSEFDANFFAIYEPLLANTVVWPTMGNHEGANSSSPSQSGPYYEAYVLPVDGSGGGVPSGTEAYYSFDYSNVHFIVLDSHDTDRSVDSVMLRWLSDDLVATDQTWIVAYWHHPPYTDGSHDSDVEGRLVDMRENVLPVLEAGGVDIVLAGHSHIYERSYLVHGAYDTPTTAAGVIVDSGDGDPLGDGPYNVAGDGTVYVVAGHGGASVSGSGAHPLMFRSEIAHGSCLIDVAGSTMTLRNLRYDGVETDRVSLIKGDGVFLLEPIGGERYLAGSTVDVVWSSSGTSDEVRLEYSLDDGVTFETIVDRTADDGHHAWVTPRRMSDAARVRVTDASNATLTATSPGPFTLSAEVDRDVIGFGSVWEYWDQVAAPPATWATDRTSWPSGQAELGYGDGDERTLIADEDPNVPTNYFRRVITVEGEVTAAEVTVLFDDGFELYVNGVAALRQNVGDVAHGSFATAQSADNELVTAFLATDLFVPGENVVAVAVKQVSASSSDVSFDLSLSLRTLVELDPDPVDGGTPPGLDAATRDAASIADAGDGVPPGPTGGCGCRVQGATGHGGVAFMVALALLGVRRRRRG